MAVLQPDQRPPRLAFSLYKRFLLAAFVIIFATSGAVATAALLQVKTLEDVFDGATTRIAGLDDSNVLDDVDPGGPQTIIVLGSDRRFVDIKAKTPTRSDTIILLRLDPDRGATAVMSLPRDLRVDVPGFGRRKINEAYALGGPKLAVQTVRELLDIPIQHVVNVNFGGFQRAVNRLGCVYADIDRKYFNDNSGPDPDYAVIDIDAGYQKLCGRQALEYVRYRHNDNDIVRGARQQGFLSEAKAQIGVSKLLGDRKELIEIFGRYTQTDIKGTQAILRLLKLTVESAKNPIQEVQIGGLEEDGADLIAPSSSIAKAAKDFLSAKATKGPKTNPDDDKTTKKKRKTSSKKKRSGLPAGLFEARGPAEDLAVPLDAKIDFPVYFPKLAVNGSTLRKGDERAYRIRDRGGRLFQAYRIAVNVPGTGQNYGIQGTAWKAPPILDSPSETRKVDGRTYELFYDGGRLRLVAWRTDKAVYWVTNTLLQVLTEKQMLGLAGGLTRVGAK